MGRSVTVAACALNQWALDFEGNLKRIVRSECVHPSALAFLIGAVTEAVSGFCLPVPRGAGGWVMLSRVVRCSRLVFDPTFF